MAAMFGLIASGRLVATNWEQISPTNCAIELPEAESVNHIVVFLTGQTPFPEGVGGAVYFAWPSVNGGPPTWQLLGNITNQKPSAIFRIGRLKKDEAGQTGSNMAGLLGHRPQNHVNALVGISVEPLNVIEGQTPAAQTEAANVSTFVEFSQKMLENLFNYAASFAVSPADLRQRQGESYVPLSALQQWYANFERRLQQNPNFWRN